MDQLIGGGKPGAGKPGTPAGDLVKDTNTASFRADVLDASMQVPVIVDFWAPWCGPCKQLGPIIEKAVKDARGAVRLVKINVDENQELAAQMRIQSIPAVYAFFQGRPVDGFVGAQPEAVVKKFVDGLLPSEEETEVAQLLRLGDVASLEQVLAVDPDNVEAITALAELRVRDGRNEDALQLLAKIPETAETRRVAAMARLGGEAPPADDVDRKLETLLATVKTDDEARQQFVDLLEVLGPDDPRTAQWRKRLTQTLY